MLVGWLSPRRQKDSFSRGFRTTELFGLSKARIERILERQVLGPIDPHEISKIEKEMLAEGIASVEKAGDRGELIGKTASIRLAGQEATLEFHDYRAEELAGAFGRNSPRSSAISRR